MNRNKRIGLLVLILFALLPRQTTTDVAVGFIVPISSGAVQPVSIVKTSARLGFNSIAAQTTSPTQLDAVYSYAWQQIATTYHTPAKLANWGQWRDKYQGKLNTLQDLENALVEMTTSLHDRWTVYHTSAELYSADRASKDGIYSMGVELSRTANGDSISYVFYGSPGASADLRRGDIIRKIGGKSISRLSQSEVEGLLLGNGNGKTVVEFTTKAGTELTTTVVFTGTAEPKVDAQLYGGSIAYARLPNFESQQVLEDLTSRLSSMYHETHGALRGIILDLRGDPGGAFVNALAAAELFLSHGVVVRDTTRDNRAVIEQVNSVSPPFAWSYTDTPFIHAMQTLPMVVLVDETSASSAEILTGALKDNGRAVVLGQTTYGKGVGYTETNLPTGGVLLVTALDYLTPTGFNLSDRGIAPDVFVFQPRGVRKDDIQLRNTILWLQLKLLLKAP